MGLYQIADYIIVLSIAGVYLSIALHALKHRAVPGALALAVLMFAAGEYAVPYLLELTSPNLKVALFLYNLSLPGASIVGPAWFMFALQYTRQKENLSRRQVILLSLIPFLSCLAAWTNPLHGYYASGFAFDPGAALPLLIFKFKLFYWINFGYAYLMVGLGIVLLIRTGLQRMRFFAVQTTFLLAGALIPAVINIIFVLGFSPIRGLDLAPFSFLITGIAWSLALFRFHFLDIVPIAREKVFETLTIGIIVLDQRDHIVDINQAAEGMLSLSHDSVLGQEFLLTIASSRSDGASLFAPDGIANEIGLTQASGQRYLSFRLIPVHGPKAARTGSLVMLEDVTQRKRLELIQGARNRALEQLSSAGTLDLILAALMQSVEQVWPGHPAAILLLNESKGRLYNGASSGLPDFYNAAMEDLEVGPNVGSCGAAVYHKQSVIVENIETHPNWEPYRDLARQAGLGACWAEPFFSSARQVLGTFAIYAGRPMAPQEQDMLLLAEIAQLAGIVIERKRAETTLRENEQRFRELYAAERRHAQELGLLEKVRMALARELDPQVVIRNVVEGIAESFGYPLVSLYMLQGEMMVLQHQVGYAQVFKEIAVSKGILGKVMRTGQAILLEDIHSDPDFLEAFKGITSEVCVPLLDRGRVLGALNVESSAGMELTRADLRLLTALSESIGVAIERARLYSEIRKNEERYRLLFYQSPVGVFHYDSQMRITNCNERFATLLRSSLQQLVSVELQQVLDPCIFPAVYQSLSGFEGQYEGEYAILPESAQIWITLRTAPLFDEKGQVQGGIGIVEDITARKEAEQAEHNQRVLSEALRDSAAALNSTFDLNQILDHLLNNVGRVVSFDTVDIRLIDENGIANVVREMGYAERGEGIDIHDMALKVDQIPNLKNMVETSEPVVVPDPTRDPDWVWVQGLTWVRSYAAIPIRIKGKVIGWIDLSSTVPNFYRPEHIERLRAFADQAAIALTNARLVDELRSVNDHLQLHLEEIQSLQAELQEQAVRDPLTGLFNRRFLQEILEREVARAQREAGPVSIIVLDIDHFKEINDSYGHQAGDRYLKALGSLLISMIRQGDFVCRYGGEEFLVLMPGASLKIAAMRAESIRGQVDGLRVQDGDRELHVTMSLGVAAYPEQGINGEEVMIRADRALYQAKQNGRNRVVVYEEGGRLNRPENSAEPEK